MKGEFSDELQFRFGDEFLFGEWTKGESESVDELQEIEGRSCNSENRRRESTVMSCCSGLSGVARGGAQGARAPPSALGLVNIVHRTASSSTPLAIPNHQLL